MLKSTDQYKQYITLRAKTERALGKMVISLIEEGGDYVSVAQIVRGEHDLPSIISLAPVSRIRKAAAFRRMYESGMPKITLLAA